MAVSLARLPKYLVLEPVSTVRIEMELTRPSCEIDVELQNPEPGRSFVLLIGKKGGPHLQRMSLSGRARVLFDPQAPGVYVLMLANPLKEPLVLRLRGKNLARRPRVPAGSRPAVATVRATRSATARRGSPPTARSDRRRSARRPRLRSEAPTARRWRRTASKD